MSLHNLTCDRFSHDLITDFHMIFLGLFDGVQLCVGFLLL